MKHVRYPKFFMEQIDASEYKLEEDHSYYAQVQGQMEVTWARWCNCIVFTSKGIYVQCILFDPVFWAELEQKLLSYYFEHFIKFASAKLFDWNCLANNNYSDCEVLCTAKSDWACNLQLSCKNYFVQTTLYFSNRISNTMLLHSNILSCCEFTCWLGINTLHAWINYYCFVALICCGLKFFQPVWFLISFVSKNARRQRKIKTKLV